MKIGPENNDILSEARRLANDARSILRLLETNSIQEEDEDKILECIRTVDYLGLKKILYPEESYTELRARAQQLGVKNYSRLDYNQLTRAIADEESLQERIREAKRNLQPSLRALQKNKKGGRTGLSTEHL